MYVHKHYHLVGFVLLSPVSSCSFVLLLLLRLLRLGFLYPPIIFLFSYLFVFLHPVCLLSLSRFFFSFFVLRFRLLFPSFFTLSSYVLIFFLLFIHSSSLLSSFSSFSVFYFTLFDHNVLSSGSLLSSLSCFLLIFFILSPLFIIL